MEYYVVTGASVSSQQKTRSFLIDCGINPPFHILGRKIYFSAGLEKPQQERLNRAGLNLQCITGFQFKEAISRTEVMR